MKGIDNIKNRGKNMKPIILTIVCILLFVNLSYGNNETDITTYEQFEAMLSDTVTVRFEFQPYIEFTIVQKDVFLFDTTTRLFMIIDILIAIDSVKVDSVLCNHKATYHIKENKQIGYKNLIENNKN